MGKRSEKSHDQALTLEYDLLSLPTAQHKAGLAGLLLLVEAMRELKRPSPPDVVHDELKAKITLMPTSFQAVMNELYGAGWVESRQTKQRTKGTGDNKQVIPPIREELDTVIDKKTRKPKQVTFYIYRDVVPGGPFFRAGAMGNLASKPGWVKIWSEAVWRVIRGSPTTREPYNERADDKDAKGAGVSKLWGQLLDEQDCRAQGRVYTMPVASSIWLGAQDHNAEYVAFQGSPTETLLLHFWNLVMQCFVPQVVDRDKKTGEVKVRAGDGYILAIPEVSDLRQFKDDYRDAMAQLPDEGKSWRPPDSFVCLPQEGALQLLSRLSARAKQRAQGRLRYSVSAIEVYHLHKPGSTSPTMTLASDRLVVDDQKLTDFERIHRNTHPLLRAHLIRALLRGEFWYRGFNRLAASTDAEWLVGHADSDWSTAQFCRGVREQFEVNSLITPTQTGASL